MTDVRLDWLRLVILVPIDVLGFVVDTKLAGFMSPRTGRLSLNGTDGLCVDFNVSIFANPALIFTLLLIERLSCCIRLSSFLASFTFIF